MVAALSVMVATYVLVWMRLYGRPQEEWTLADRGVAAIGEVVCICCWFVVVFQALRTALN